MARSAKGLTVERGACGGIGDRFRVSLHRLEWRLKRRALGKDECRNVASVVIAQVVVRHGCRAGIGLRIFDPGIHPLARSLVGDVLQRGRIIVWNDVSSVALLDGVTVGAAVADDELPSLVEEWGPGLTFQMALPTAGFDVLGRQQRLLPDRKSTRLN